PVGALCQARRTNQQAEYPVKSFKRQRPHKTVAVGIVFKAEKILIDQRKPDGMLGGLWEFPGGRVEDDERGEEAVVREVKEELGVDVEVLTHLATVEHQYTHFTVSLHAFVCRFVSGSPKAIGCDDWKWVTPGELSDYAFPRANGKLIEILLKSPLPKKIRKVDASGK
ncbi:MAG: 8-oxo-dGTP diphosphatase MutT, partial [Pirellulaceae bacterium]